MPALDPNFTDAAGETPAAPARSISLPGRLHAQLLAEARAAYPRECCGLIEGVRCKERIEILCLHPTRNLAHESDRFAIDPTEHIRLLRTLRGTGREIVGCYHSHPDGAPAPSEHDRERAHDEDFVWLIASLGRDDIGSIGAFIFASGTFSAP